MTPNFFSRLPSDVLCLILRRLSVADYVRSGVVCISWRQATAGNPHREGAQTPWLILPGGDDDDLDSFTAFSITDRTNRSFRLPQIRGKLCTGSSQGSIVAVDSPDIVFPFVNAPEILLLNPLTGAELRLPPVTVASPFLPIGAEDSIKYPPVKKVVFSPSSSVAAALYEYDDEEEQHSLSFARIGGSAWTPMPHLYFDVILHKGVFYMLNSDGSLLSFHPESASLKHCRCRFSSFDDYYQIYLVESVDGDHLMLVCRIVDADSMESFTIFRLDASGLRWVEMESLGEVAIFVGNNFSVCVFTRGLQQLRGNCVYFYFTEEDGDDVGVFNLEDGSVELLDSLPVYTRHHNRYDRSPPFWFMPTSS